MNRRQFLALISSVPMIKLVPVTRPAVTSRWTQPRAWRQSELLTAETLDRAVVTLHPRYVNSAGKVIVGDPVVFTPSSAPMP
jgi:hypothetical protein